MGFSSVEQLLSSATFDRVEFYQVSASIPNPVAKIKREQSSSHVEVAASSPPISATKTLVEKQKWVLTIRVTENQMYFRVRFQSGNKLVKYIADAAVYYDVDGDAGPSKSIVMEFVKAEAVPTIIPFIREALLESARRLGVPPPRLARIPDGFDEAIKQELTRDQMKTEQGDDPSTNSNLQAG